MKYGLTKTDFDYIEEIAVKPLQKAGAKIWVFGSRARGDFKKFSDLDLYIESDQDLNRQINEITEILIESNLPIKIEFVQSKYFAKSYRDSFEADKILWI